MTVAAPKFLCESCGYDLSATDPAARCPECGRPVADSHHSRRVGSPYQRNPRFRSAATTFFQFLTDPARSFRESSPWQGSLFQYVVWVASFSSLITVSPFVIIGAAQLIEEFTGAHGLHSGELGRLVTHAVGGFFATLVIYGFSFFACLILHLLATLVIRAWGTALRVRNDAETFLVIAHSTSGPLLIAALGVPVGSLTAFLAGTPLPLPIITLIFAALALFFWLRIVHIGLRELRYANPPPAAHQTEDAASAVE